MRWILVVALVGMAGCAQMQQQQAQKRAAERNAAMAAAGADCRKEYPQPGQRVPRVKCVAVAENRIYAGTLESDLVAIRAAKRIVLAEQIDAGKITEAEANLQLAQLNADLRNTDIARRNGIQQAQAAASAADAANTANDLELIRQGAAMMAPPPRVIPAPALRTPVQTNCVRAGVMTNCTTY